MGWVKKPCPWLEAPEQVKHMGSGALRLELHPAVTVWLYSMSFIDGCKSMLASSIGRVGSEQGQASKWMSIWPERNQAKIPSMSSGPVLPPFHVKTRSGSDCGAAATSALPIYAAAELRA